ncbi:MAG: hypothetical protein C0508_08750, partial [Cyanobacteria bacterium PR.023]|nr:hypothetical protein [Cyanobacteria bacterium PR.023]
PQKRLLIQMRRKILVVDDAPIVRLGTAMSLTDMGFEVDQAQSGEEALDRVKHTRYAIILMDYHMPDMDGTECARLIRSYESETGTRTPIVCLTSEDPIEVCQSCLDAGMDDCLSKTCSTAELEQMVVTWKHNGSNLISGQPHSQSTCP